MAHIMYGKTILVREMLGAPSNIAGAPSNFYEWTILPFNKKL